MCEEETRKVVTNEGQIEDSERETKENEQDTDSEIIPSAYLPSESRILTGLSRALLDKLQSRITVSEIEEFVAPQSIRAL